MKHKYPLYAITFLSIKCPTTNLACKTLFISSFFRLNIGANRAKDS